MTNQPQQKYTRRAYYRVIRAYRYIGAITIVIILSLVLSFLYKDWSYFSRSGGFVVLIGALLGLRKLFRKGPSQLNQPNQPINIKSGKLNQINMVGVSQEIDDIGDGFAQELGLFIVIAGTCIGSFGALLMNHFWPWGT